MSSSAGAPSRNRPGTAYAAAAAAKERRQKIIAAVLGVVMIAVFAYEIPQLLKIIRGSKSPVALETTPTTPLAALPSSGVRLLKTLRHHPAGDPFARPAPSVVDPGPRVVAVPAGSVDPFARPGTASSIPSTTASATASPLPEQIVIERPAEIASPATGGSSFWRRSRPGKGFVRQHVRRESEKAGSHPGFCAQLLQPSALARRLLGRLHRPVRDALGRNESRRGCPYGWLPDGVHSGANRLPLDAED